MKLKLIKEKLLADNFYLPVSIYECPAFFNDEKDKEKEDFVRNTPDSIKADIITFLEDFGYADEDDISEGDTLTEKIDEWADSNVNPYNYRRLQWIANNLYNAEIVNDTVQEYGISSK